MRASGAAAEENRGSHRIPGGYLTNEFTRSADGFRIRLSARDRPLDCLILTNLRPRAHVDHWGFRHLQIAFAIRTETCQGPLHLALRLGGLQEIVSYRLIDQLVHRSTQKVAETGYRR